MPQPKAEPKPRVGPKPRASEARLAIRCMRQAGSRKPAAAKTPEKQAEES